MCKCPCIVAMDLMVFAGLMEALPLPLALTVVLSTTLTAALAVALTLAQEGIQDLLNLTYSKLTTHKSQGE